MKRLFILIALGVMLIASCLTAFNLPKLNLAGASETFPFGGAEYSNGTIVVAGSPCSIWYDWVNVSGTQIINYVLYSDANSSAPTPIANLVGQHLQLANGTDAFVASALDKMEVYKDKNGDGIPEANFTSGDSEILYNMYMNMSDRYSIIPIQQTMEGTVPHYLWGFTYVSVYAYLQSITVEYGVAAKLMLDHITVSYDFSLNGNVSNLKISLDIGRVTSIEVLDSSQLSLDGLSLALLYPTTTYSQNAYSAYVNGESYNSTTADDSAVDVDVARVALDGTKAYDFVFGDNYTLYRGENNETHETRAEAAALSSVPTEIYGPAVWQTTFFRNELNLSDLFGGSWPDITIDYNASSLIYRLCFPVWDGARIQDDPVYVGYLFSNTEVPEMPKTVILLPMIIAATLLVFVLTKKRRFNPAKKNKCSLYRAH